MSPRDSFQNNDARANRLPYHPEPRQGRFGRVENWREAEERRQEQIRRQRRAHSRSARMTDQQPAQETPQVEPQRQEQRSRKRPVEVNPWQQGRFGRVENWAEVERRQAQSESTPHDEPQHQTNATAARIQESKTTASERSQARVKRPGYPSRGQQSQQQQMQSQQARSQTAASAQKTRSQQQAQHATQQRASRVQNVQVSGQHSVAQSQDQQAESAQHQQQARRQPYAAVSSSEFVPTDKASNYSRDSYTSRSSARSAVSFTDVRPGQGSHSRRSYANQPTGQRTSIASRVPQIPKKIIVVVAAVFAIVIVVGIMFSCGQSDETGGASGGVVTPVQTQVMLPTPIMSESSGVVMHSAVAMNDLTEILIHNSSYAYANEITTRLTEATNTEILAAHGTGRVASEQPTGDNWMTGEFIRCFRSGNAGPVMSAIDCGGPVGATVYAPVTGEVVLVKEYKLYNEIDDYRVHIQPTGRPDLDVVLIHLTDVTVKAGDKVTAGVTPIAKIRDIYQFLDESLQLRNYTAEDDNGNHTHIQVNNAKHPEYTALDELKPQQATGE